MSSWHIIIQFRAGVKEWPRKLTMVWGKLIDRREGELNKDTSVPLLKSATLSQQAGNRHPSTPTLGHPVRQLAIFLKMEHVVTAQDTSGLTSRVPQQSFITDFKTK